MDDAIAVRRAGRGDIESLIRLRLDYFRLSEGALSPGEEGRVAKSLSVYLDQNIDTGRFAAFLAEIGGNLVGCAFLTIWERPGGPAFTAGRVGTVMNVLTYPQYRRRGVGRRLMEAVIEAGKIAGLSNLDLLATGDGRPLYHKLGFTELPYCPMRLSLEK